MHSPRKPWRRSFWIVGLALGVVLLLRALPAAPLSAGVPLSTAVYDADGALLRLTRAGDGQFRLWTPLAQIAPTLPLATRLYEDRHFDWHPGVDPVALGRALWATVAGPRRMGGSTLTMQLARRLFGIDSSTPTGKLRQIAGALWLELRHSKREILEAYLNLAPYGGNVEGVGAAAAVLFGKRPDRLLLGEALALAVIPQSPARRGRPGPALLEARARLTARLRARVPLSPADEASLHAPLVLRPADALPFRAPHFVEEILAEETRFGGTGRAIATTLDGRAQRLVERQLHAYVSRAGRYGIRNAAALLVDHRTREVKALVGSAGFFDRSISGQVNGATARRSPGSTLKPFTYALGLEQGVIHPLTLLRDVPTAFAAYSPENFDGRFAGPLPAREALVRSRNIPALTIAAQLERPGLYDFLKTAGVDLPRPEAHYGLGITLGTAEVSLEELVTLYTMLANGGTLAPLNSRPEPAPPATRLLSEEAAYLTLEMLEDNPRPEAPRAGLEARGRTPVAWKTGTSWGFRDAWTIGVFGPYVLGVWIGNFSGEGNPAFVGLQAAAPLFFQIVDALEAESGGLPAARRARPAALRRVEVCAVSGGLPTPACPHRRATWFIPGRSPVTTCNIHRRVPLAADGRRTCAAGPPARGSDVYEVWSSDIAQLFAAAGLPRRPLPPPAAGCEEAGRDDGAPPRISSPLAGVTYAARASDVQEPIALRADADGDARELFWFIDEALVGRTRGGQPLFWKARPGRFLVRVVDDRGRADSRPLRIEAMP